MSDEIKAGDLVMTIKPFTCCGASPKKMGVPFIAGESKYCHLHCNICGGVIWDVLSVEAPNGMGWVQKSRLKKIKPLSDDESTDTITDLDMTIKEVA